MGLLDRFRRSAASTPQTRRSLAVVLLSDERPADMPAVLAYLRAQGIDSPDVTLPVQPTLTSASIPGGTVEVEFVPGQVAEEYLKGPVMVAAWHWSTAAADVPKHRSHLIVRAASNSLNAVDLRLLHSKWVAAVAAVTNALGVYVGEAMLVRAAQAYITEALSGSREVVPVMLWVGFNPVNDNGVFSAYTTGLSAFGLHELEVHKTNRPSGSVLGTMADVASYELQTGRVLEDGATFGFTESDRIAVRYARSAFLPDERVSLLAL